MGGLGNNTIDGGEGSDFIRITGSVDTSGSNFISGGVDEDEEKDWDILQIDQNNMQDIIGISGSGAGGHISGFEQLLLDINDGGELTLDDTLLSQLTGINSEGVSNQLVIGVNQSVGKEGDGHRVISGDDDGTGTITLTASGLEQVEGSAPNLPANAPAMDGYTAYTYTNDGVDALVYIQNILLASGTD
jgi:hypothetical protein